VREGVAEGIRIAREERKPRLIEAFTYRFRGHSAADPEVYREKEEVEEWRTKDPIETFAGRCVEAGALGQEEVDRIHEDADEAVVEAVEFADGSPEPPLDSLYDNLYVVTRGESQAWYAVDERSPEPHRGEDEPEAPATAKELAEAGAAHAGQPAGPRPNPAREGDAGEGVEPRVEAESSSLDFEEETYR